MQKWLAVAIRGFEIATLAFRVAFSKILTHPMGAKIDELPLEAIRHQRFIIQKLEAN